jgi:exosome complex component CSL4
MNYKKKESGQFVVPGEQLGVIEEFMSDSGTYVKQGIVYSKTTGRALMDILNKKVSVYSLVRNINIPRVGSLVVGQVLQVRSKKALLRIYKVGKNNMNSFFSALLHISDTSPSYVDTMFQVCKTGDIMRAKVVSDKNRTFQLSTIDENLGVIYAFCSECGHMLLLNKGKMWCNECNRPEKRKIASDYGKAE